MICDFLLLEGHWGERTKTTGRMIEGKTIKRGMFGAVQTKSKWIPGTSTAGSSDIKAVINGKFIAIEVKYGNDKQSLKQTIYEANILMSGGQYWIVKDFMCVLMTKHGMKVFVRLLMQFILGQYRFFQSISLL